MDYQSTSLWKKTLGFDNENVKPLRDSFFEAHKNAEFLLAKIRNDFPNLTIHDISHVDSLWNVADTIIGKDYDINPLEGYILGISFLIHDAALSYDTIGGIDKLRNTVEWKDAYADGANGKDEEIFKKECDFTAIRALHAREAESILSKIFTKDNGTTFYIIDDDSLRRHYGELIGKIAASHHWDIDDVSNLKSQINPRREYPNKWKINAQKLACILRCADAGHIDNGRAPDNIYNILSVNGVSKQHWNSQNHLCQVCEDEKDKSMLCITSSDPFAKEEFAAWNVAYDAIKVFDNEIKASNELLKEYYLEFPHNGVSGASSKEALAKYIETKDWEPCSFNVQASNVKALVVNLGGRKLYGENNTLLIILRELIQNARDAIMARKLLDKDFQDGRINVCTNNYPDGRPYIEVSDNGIGMSKKCVENYLLNFGSSYWHSSLVKQENPGLKSKGFSSIGKYGIGFFSVFMLSKYVQVTTRRYNAGTDQTIRIEFPKGLTLTPIVSKCSSASNVSTSVRFDVNNATPNQVIDHKHINEFDIFLSQNFKFIDALKIVTSGLDINVFFKKKNSDYKCIHTDITSLTFDKKKWLRGLNIGNVENLDFYAERLETIRDKDGRFRGLVVMPGEDCYNKLYPSILTIGGLTSSLDMSFNNSFIGYIDLKEHNISRNGVVIDDSLINSLKEWIETKYRENYEKIIKSPSIATFFRSFLTRFHIYSITKKLLDDNTLILYKNYISGSLRTKSGFENEIRYIHCALYSGILKNVGDISIYEGVRLSVQEERQWFNFVDNKPENTYVSIISKFVYLWGYKLFTNGTEECLRIWLDFTLHREMNKMVDWKSADMSFFYKMIKSGDITNLCDYLNKNLKTTDELYGKGL